MQKQKGGRGQKNTTEKERLIYIYQDLNKEKEKRIKKEK